MWLHSQDVYADNTADCLLPKNGEEASTQFKEGLSTCQQRHATYTWLSTEDCCRHSLLTAHIHSGSNENNKTRALAFSLHLLVMQHERAAETESAVWRYPPAWRQREGGRGVLSKSI